MKTTFHSYIWGFTSHSSHSQVRATYFKPRSDDIIMSLKRQNIESVKSNGNIKMNYPKLKLVNT